MKRWIFSLFSILLTASTALADGDLPTRRMSGSEAAAFRTLQSTIRSALPKTPADYNAAFSGFDLKEVPETMSSDKMAWMSFSAKYTLRPEVRESRMHNAQMALIQGSSDQQARRAALEARSRELKLSRKNTRDPAEKERIRAELKKINAEENALTDEIASGASAGWATRGPGGVDRNLPPKELSVRLLVNQDVHLQDIAKPYQVPGVPLAFAQKDKCQDAGSYCITALLGDFTREKKISGTTQYTLHNANLGVPTKPRGMALIVSGPQERPESVQNFLKQIDIAKLQALLP